jgi:hypothetical protein
MIAGIASGQQQKIEMMAGTMLFGTVAEPPAEGGVQFCDIINLLGFQFVTTCFAKQNGSADYIPQRSSAETTPTGSLLNNNKEIDSFIWI